MAKHLIVALAVLVGACAAKEEASPARAAESAVATSVAAAAPALTKIADRSTVCMVNDRDMGSPQIPVVVEGKTYYGCCKMCEKRLHGDPSVRIAMDPVSHAKVDKAVAVLARDNSGNVFYFADEASFAAKARKF
jgi:YHS domain-containing protein